MSVLTRMFIVYTVVIVLIALVGVLIFSYVSGSIEDNLYGNLSATAARMNQQMDSLIRPMEYTSMHLLSNHRFLAAMEDLASIERVGSNNLIYINLAEKEIYSVMMSYSFYKYFYRVSVYNQKFDYFSSNYTYLSQAPEGGYRAVIESLPWVDTLLEKNGVAVILPPFDDPWDFENPQRVFALARSLRGTPEFGFVEVQQPYEALEEIFTFGDDGAGTSACAVTREGEVLYDGGYSGEVLDYYLGVMAEEPGIDVRAARQNPATGSREVFAEVCSDYSGVTILLIQDERLLLEPLRALGWQMMTIFLMVVALSCLFFFLQSRNLLSPLRQLKREMEVTRLENLPENATSVATTNDEIASLTGAFNDLKGRLGELIERELDLRTLHMQASFDALQAQVNPHFIYNILGVVSNRAALGGDEVICNICGAIATMLRYSVDTKTRMVSLADELAHLDQYAYLMQERFEHRFEYSTSVDPEIRAVPLPKMVLQPLVENTVAHGYSHSEGVMQVAVTGRREAGGWRLEISDNGEGFAPEVLAALHEKFTWIDSDRGAMQSSGSGLGGLGIVNIYARLRILAPQVTFEAKNKPEGGALVVLSGPMPPPDETVK